MRGARIEGHQGSAHRGPPCALLRSLGFAPGGRQARQACRTEIHLTQAESRCHHCCSTGERAVAQARVLGTGRTVAGGGDMRSRDSQDLTEMGGEARRRRTAGGVSHQHHAAPVGYTAPLTCSGWAAPGEESAPSLPEMPCSPKGSSEGASCSGGHRRPHSPNGPLNADQIQSTPCTTKVNLIDVFTTEAIDF